MSSAARRALTTAGAETAAGIEAVAAVMTKVRATGWTAAAHTSEELCLEVEPDGAALSSTSRASLDVLGTFGTSSVGLSVPVPVRRAALEAAVHSALSLRGPGSGPIVPPPAQDIVPGTARDWSGAWDGLVDAWLPSLKAVFRRRDKPSEAVLVAERRTVTLANQEGAVRHSVRHRTSIELTRLSWSAGSSVSSAPSPVGSISRGASRLFALSSPRPRSILFMLADLPRFLPPGTGSPRAGSGPVRLSAAVAARMVLHLFASDALEATVPGELSARLRRALGVRAVFPDHTPRGRGPRTRHAGAHLELAYAVDEGTTLPSSLPTRCSIASGALEVVPGKATLVVEDVEDLTLRREHLRILGVGHLFRQGEQVPLGDIAVDIPFLEAARVASRSRRGRRARGFAFGAVDVFVPEFKVVSATWRRL